MGDWSNLLVNHFHQEKGIRWFLGRFMQQRMPLPTKYGHW
jgi:hypothetical protein